MIQTIQSFKSYRVDANFIIPVSQLSNILLFSPDPTNIFTFDHQLETFESSVNTPVICIEFNEPFTSDGSVNEYLENGHHISYNRSSLTVNHPTHVYKTFGFSTVDRVQHVLLISSGIQTTPLSFDFIYKSIPFTYSTLFSLFKTSRLIFDLETEFPKVSRENSYTFILQILCNVVTPIELKIFSNTPIHMSIPASIDILSIHIQYDAVTRQLKWTSGGTVFSIPHTNDIAVVELVTVRTIPYTIVTVHNLIVLPGEIHESFLDSVSENNIFIGNKAGFLNHNGTQNIFIGNEAGGINASGTNNIFIGDKSGAFSTSGHNNVFLGPHCGSHVESDKNIFIGYRSGTHTTKGGQNIFIGNECGTNNTTGSNNICLGNHLDTTGTNNILLTNDLIPQFKTESNNLQIGNLITGNMDTKETYIDGSLYINNYLLHPISKSVRLSLVTATHVDDLNYTAILYTGCEKINLIQRMKRDVGTVTIIECRASMSPNQYISISCTFSNESFVVTGQLTSDQSKQDSFQITFFEETLSILATA
jgi:hypothetical protein